MSDLISREAAYWALVTKGWASKRYKLGEIWELNEDEIREALDSVPSEEPERETGKWVGIREYCNYLRSLDGKMYVPSGIGITLKYCNLCWESAERDTNYCPNCGAEMELVEDIPMEYFENGGI